jgi:subtilisin family serine protease
MLPRSAFREFIDAIEANKALQAISWAIEKEVDIISMSLALYEDPNDVMKEAVVEANRKKILLLASVHDEGSSQDKAYPASYDDVMAIATTDKYGSLLGFTPGGSYQYRLKGENVFTGAVPYLSSQERVGGSSVATAIAAGLSSLILSCHYITLGNQLPKNEPWKREIVEHYFNKMLADNSPKFVLLKKFCELESMPMEKLDTFDVRAQMRKWFSFKKKP